MGIYGLILEIIWETVFEDMNIGNLFENMNVGNFFQVFLIDVRFHSKSLGKMTL